MSKKILLLGVLLSLILTTPTKAQQMVTIPAEAYQTILKRLEALQRRVEQLERERQESLRLEAKTKRMEKDISEIYDTLDEVETKAIKDRINLGAELRTRVDFYKLKDYLDKNTNQKIDWVNDNYWSNRFRLNLEARISPRLFFHGRLAVYKNWSDSDRITLYSDPNRSHVPDNTTVKLDRAYVDWIVPDLPVPLALTFGRHPSTEGPPFEFKENRARQSTYPALLFDGEADGIVATLGLERYLGWKNAGFRIAYGKGYQNDNDFYIYLDDRSGLDDLNVLGLFFETELPRLPKSLLVLSWVKGWNFVDLPTNTQKNLGDMQIFGLHLQIPKIFTGFDVFFSWGLNKSDPNGNSVDLSSLGLGQVGLLSSAGQKDHTGWAIYTGFRYSLPWKRLKNPKVGFEYNHGSKYWFSFTQGSTEIYNKLATRGDVFDFYYIQPLEKNLFLRTGYTYINYDYNLSGWHIGEPQKTDEKLTNFYMLIDCRF
ncbi:DUF3373 family protein [Thermosulfuriphilus sp.]